MTPHLKSTSLASEAANKEPHTATTIFFPVAPFSDLTGRKLYEASDKIRKIRKGIR